MSISFAAGYLPGLSGVRPALAGTSYILTRRDADEQRRIARKAALAILG